MMRAYVAVSSVEASNETGESRPGVYAVGIR